MRLAVEHWFGCRATEPGFARDIGAIEVWLIDWLRCFLKVATEMAEWTDSGRLLQRDAAQEWIALGTNGLILLFDLSERDGSDAASIAFWCLVGIKQEKLISARHRLYMHSCSFWITGFYHYAMFVSSLLYWDDNCLHCHLPRSNTRFPAIPKISEDLEKEVQFFHSRKCQGIWETHQKSDLGELETFVWSKPDKKYI